MPKLKILHVYHESIIKGGCWSSLKTRLIWKRCRQYKGNNLTKDINPWSGLGEGDMSEAGEWPSPRNKTQPSSLPPANCVLLALLTEDREPLLNLLAKLWGPQQEAGGVREGRPAACGGEGGCRCVTACYVYVLRQWQGMGRQGQSAKCRCACAR